VYRGFGYTIDQSFFNPVFEPMTLPMDTQVLSLCGTRAAEPRAPKALRRRWAWLLVHILAPARTRGSHIIRSPPREVD
jgi:hypothetical protein